MKNSAIKLVWATTAYLVAFTALSALGIAFAVLWGLLVMGQLLVIYMVYKVLTDNYTTKKKFGEWYGDVPKEKLDRV